MLHNIYTTFLKAKELRLFDVRAVHFSPLPSEMDEDKYWKQDTHDPVSHLGHLLSHCPLLAMFLTSCVQAEALCKGCSIVCHDLIYALSPAISSRSVFAMWGAR